MNFITLPPVKRGDTWAFSFIWKEQNTPINLTNCTARMQIRNKSTLAMAAEATTENNYIVINGATGEVKITYPASVTNNINPGTYVSDLELTFTDTNVVKSSNTISIEVIEDITR